MSALENEIIEKFRRLTPESRLQVLAALQEEVSAQRFDLALWLTEAEKVRDTLKRDANRSIPSSSDLLNEVRDERDADILRSIGFGDSAGDTTT